MEKINKKQYYTKKLENIKVLESINYRDLEKKQRKYKQRTDFYKQKKDVIGTKIRMLEVYQNLWGNVESELNKQAFLNEEFWNNIMFNMIKYEKFMQELSQLDYDDKIKTSIDKKADKQLWESRKEVYNAVKNDISYMNNSFNKMHSDIHNRALIQRDCIEKHIRVMKSKKEEVELEKEHYRNIFHEIQKDLGSNGNYISRQALEDYKITLIRKIQSSDIGANKVELDIA